LKIFTIVSPDKLTQSMFIDYYRSQYVNKEVIPMDLNSLLSVDAQERGIQSAIETIESTRTNLDLVDIIIKYKIKNKTQVIVPDHIMSISDDVLKFDIYSAHPEVLKASDKESIEAFNTGWLEHYNKYNV
jgi:hypothetical protein